MNFDTFHNCILILIKVSTKEEWDVIMYEAIKYNNSTDVQLYLSSFIIISSFLMMNIFIMIIVDLYEDSY